MLKSKTISICNEKSIKSLSRLRFHNLEDVTFIDITRKIPYLAVKIQGETRSYGSKYKYPTLERAMAGRSISEQFMQTQETTLIALSVSRGRSKEDKAGLMRIVPTTVKDIRGDRALKQSVNRMQVNWVRLLVLKEH